MLAGTDDHLTWLSPVILNLENMGLTHLESEIRVSVFSSSFLELRRSLFVDGHLLAMLFLP